MCFALHCTLSDAAMMQGDQVNKTVFIIFFQGDQLRSRVKKICEGSVSLYSELLFAVKTL